MQLTTQMLINQWRLFLNIRQMRSAILLWIYCKEDIFSRLFWIFY